MWMDYVVDADDIDVNGGTWKPEYDQALQGLLLIERGVQKVLEALKMWRPLEEQEGTC